MADQSHKLNISCSTTEPALAAYLFDLLRTQARACGFPDVDRIEITVNARFSGLTHTFPEFEELKARLDQVWLTPEYVYTVEERDEKGNKKLIRLEEDPPHVEGPTVGEERRRLMREEQGEG